MSIVKISEYFNPTGGLFSKMAFDFEVMTKQELDFMFFVNYSEKNPAPVVTKMLSLPPTDTELTNLAHMIESLYGVKWNKLKSLTKLTYDPIHNYKDKLTEVIKDTEVIDGTLDTVYSKTKTGNITKNDTRTDNLTDVVDKNSTLTVNSTVDDGVYGFNSDTPNDSDTSKTVETNTDVGKVTKVNTGTQTNVGNDTTSLSDIGTSGDIKKSTETTDRTRESTHEGNIGNLTTQQLMTQEIELWKWNFIQTVLADLNDFLTIPIYLS